MSTAEHAAAVPRILLVESDAAAREHLAFLLGRQGYRIEAVPTLAAAQPFLGRDGATALLLTNLLLDDGGALEVARRFAGSGRPALGVTDVYFGPTARQLLLEQVGLADVFEVPLDEARLVERVTALVPRPIPAVEESESQTAETALETVIPPALDLARIEVEGELQDADIAAVLARLALDRCNGALMLQSERIKKLVYLEDGIPVGIKSNLLAECLGQMLVQEGGLSTEACDESLEEMRRSGRQQGQVLVAMGKIRPDELEAAMVRQFLYKLQQLFTWSSGAYRYRDAAIPAAYHAPAVSDAVNLIWRGILESRPVDRARALLEPYRDSPVSLSPQALDLGNLQLTESEGAILGQLDGTRTVAQVAEAGEDAWLLLYALTAFGAVSYLAP